MGVVRERIGTLLRAGSRGVLAAVLFAVSFLTIRDDSIWVFGSSGGAAFRDNSKYLYLHTVTERPHLRAVWLSRNDEVVRTLQEQGYEAYHTDSLRGMWLNLHAGSVFVSHGMPDVNRWCSGGARKVLLWHGIALKRIGWDGYKLRKRIERIKRHVKDTFFDRYDYIVVPTEAMVEPFASAFRISGDRILPLGYPRNDVLVGSWSGHDPTSDVDLAASYRERYSDATVLLYMPTIHRETGERVVDQFDLAELDRWLAERNAIFLAKPHPSEPFDLNEGEYSRIVEVPEDADVYSLLPHTDGLITDYSSVYFDYLLVDNPIVFYPFDLERYRAERGFYLEYGTVTPGPMATDFDGLLRCLGDVLDADEFVGERAAVRETFLSSVESRNEAIADRFDAA